jgi:methyl-accepting chemotaxis protein
MKIFAKLIGGFALVAAVCALVGGIGWYGIFHTREGLQTIAHQSLPGTEAVGLLMEGMNGLKSAERTLMISSLSSADRTHEIENLSSRLKVLEDGLAELEGLEKDAEEQQIFSEVSQGIAVWRTEHEKLVELVKKVKLDNVGSLEAVLVGRKLDHVKWVAQLENSVARNEQFTGQLDPALCGMGKFLSTYTTADQPFMDILKSFDGPHHRLHQLGETINASLAEGDQGKAGVTISSQVRPTLAEIEGLFDKSLAYVKDDIADLDRAKEIGFGSGRIAFSAVDKSLDKLVQYVSKYSKQVTIKAETDAARSQTLSLVAVVVGIIAALVIGFLMARSFATPMRQTVEMLKELELGHLSARLNLQRKDEIGEMATTLDEFADNLQRETVGILKGLASGDVSYTIVPRDAQDEIRNSLKTLGDDLNQVLGQIQTSGEQINSGASQVSDGAQSLSQGATESAASLEEITSSMGELSGRTKDNAENAQQANQLSIEARDAAQKGSGQMKQMVAAMDDIRASGQSISKIIKVIDEIAFQTNLLALNAAVEAARAGQHGKGFAVVAEEVRNLAARSAKAARETAELIEGSVQKTENGSQIARTTADALEEIVSSITKTADLVAEIAAASNEQALGIGQINQGLEQIDDVTQANTASAEESAAAAEELSGQAMELQRLLQQFTLRKDSSARSYQASYAGSRPALTAKPPQRTPAASPKPSAKPSAKISWSEPKAGSGWQAAEKSAASQASKGVDPASEIALDDSEFGKY